MNFLCESEIAKLGLEIIAYEHVLEFNVQVGVVCFGVETIHSARNLCEEMSDQGVVLNRTILSNHIEEVHSAQFSRHITRIFNSFNSLSIFCEVIVFVALDVPWDLQLAVTSDEVMRLEYIGVVHELLENCELFLRGSVVVFLAVDVMLNGERV